MKKLRIIRAVLIILIVLFIVLAISNFYKPPEIKIKETSNASYDANMVIEKGEHDIFSKGEKFAHLSYKEAIQKEKKLEVKKVEVCFLKNKGELKADNAIFENSVLLFNSKVKGFFPEKKVKLSIEPPSFLKNKNLTGEKGIILNFPEFKLSGNNFVFDIENSFLKIREDAFFDSKDASISSVYNVSYFKDTPNCLFFKNAVFSLKREELKAKADLIKNLTEKKLVYFSGKSEIISENLTLFFNSGVLKKQDTYRLEIKGGFSFKSADFKGKGYNCLFLGNRIDTDYIEFNYNQYSFSGIENTFKTEEKTISGKNPYLYSTVDNKKIKGKSYTLKNSDLFVENPVFKDKSIVLFSSNCILKKNRDVVFPDAVYGILNKYRFSGSSAVIKKNSKVINSGEVVSLADENDLIKGKVMELDLNGNIMVKDNVLATKKMREGKSGSIFCNFMRITDRGERLFLKDNVSILSQTLRAYPESAIVFKNYAILFNCNFKIEGRYSGFSRVIVILFKERYSYLFFAKVQDANGNTLVGDKLTLDNVTDRIFIEKTKKKGQVEVKIKI